MNKLVQALDNTKLTENGAVAFNSSMSPCLDLFALGGAYRSRSKEDKANLAMNAWAKDAERAIKTIFYLRDIRGGQGEREVARVMLGTVLSKGVIPEITVKYLISLLPEYGRWDDVVYIGLDYPELRSACWDLVKDQLLHDLESTKPSLLAKWMPTETAHSKRARECFSELISYMDLTPRTYRKALSKLRKTLGVIERSLTLKEYQNIIYEWVPSQAMLRYRKVFLEKDPERFNKYLESVRRGRAKINTSTLYPYQIIHKILGGVFDQSLDILWSNLPNYINPKNKNALVLCDVSGSMYCQVSEGVSALDVSVSLAIYFAEKCEGEFENRFITFSGAPELVSIEGSNICEKVRCVSQSEWGFNTDICGAFDKILTVAKRANVPAEDMPRVMYVITDMEFDQADSRYKTNYESIKDKYEESGYDLPHLVFWNVDARNDTLPVTKDELGVTLVSGLSPITFSFAVESKDPMEFMDSVILSDRYKPVTLSISK